MEKIIFKNKNPNILAFSLIEVLIAMLILSFGFLTIAGMEIRALRNTQQAYWQSVAVTQIASLTERLRANQSGFARAQECQRWNLQNKLLLPEGQGACICNESACNVTLAWKNHQLALQILFS